MVKTDLEITRLLSVHCNKVKNDYRQGSRVL